LEQLSESVALRGASYSLLARLYQHEVDQALLNELRAMLFPAHTGNDDLDRGYQLLARYLSGVWENSVDELAVDYSRIFIGYGFDAFSAAYPFESVYTSEKRLLMQDARDEVLAIYRSAGLDKQASWKEGEDHLGVELEFQSVLCQRASVALNKGDEDEAHALLKIQANFLEDHLLSWVPLMTADLQRFAQTDFYRALGYITDGFLAFDREFLKEVLTGEQG